MPESDTRAQAGAHGRSRFVRRVRRAAAADPTGHAAATIEPASRSSRHIDQTFLGVSRLTLHQSLMERQWIADNGSKRSVDLNLDEQRILNSEL